VKEPLGSIDGALQIELNGNPSVFVRTYNDPIGMSEKILWR
jgi:hypothetical protein